MDCPSRRRHVNYLTALKTETKGLQGGGRGKALFFISSGSFLLIGVQMMYPVLLPELRAAYGFDLTTAGLLLTVLWLANAAGQLPGGMLADRIGEGTTLVVGVGISALTILLIVTVTSTAALFVATLLLGAGLALYGVARYTAMDDLFPDRVGTAIGVVLAAADAGQALLPPIASFVAIALVWQLGFGFTIPIFVLVGVGLWLYVPGRTSNEPDDVEVVSLATVRAVVSELRTPTLGYGAALFVIYVSVWVAFTSFYPTYLIEVKGLSATVAATLFGAFFAIGVLVKPISGAAYDRIGIRFTLVSLALVSGGALVALPLVDSAVGIAVLTVLVAPILGGGTVTQSHVIHELSGDVKGTGLGLVRTGGMGMAALTPTLFGAAADRGFFDQGFWALAGLAAVMILLAMRLPE